MSGEASGDAYNVEDMAAHIARHSFERHVTSERRFKGRDNERYGPELNIGSEQDLARHVEETIRDPKTLVFHATNSRDIYYNKDSNTFVIVNSAAPDMGTCYRDRDRQKEFTRLLKRDNAVRAQQNSRPAQVRLGGIEKLYPGTAMKTVQPESHAAVNARVAEIRAEQEAKSKDQTRTKGRRR